MNKIQKLHFRNFGDFLDYLPDEEKEIVLFLRNIILEIIPNIKEKLAYNVPFYYRYQRICFIWPSSVPWGGIKEGVSLGFTKGHLLTNPERYLTGEDKKEIRSKVFHTVKEINVELMKDLIFEAVELDNQFGKR